MNNLTKMHCYKWSGINSTNQKKSGNIYAISINFAKAQLASQGIALVSIQKKLIIFPHAANKKISLQDIVIFFRQFATLICAGIPILQCLEILRASQEKYSLQTLLNRLSKEIEAGKGFAASLKQFPIYFNEVNCYLIQAGEQSGTLDLMLNRVASYQEKMLHFKKKIKQALLYPALISFVALSVALIMLIFIIPQFEVLFESMHVNLPAFTAVVIQFSKILTAKTGFLLLLLIIGLILFCYYKNTRPLKSLFDKLIIKIPLLNNLSQKIFMSRFTRSLATLLSAGIPIMDALRISSNTVGNKEYHKHLVKLQIDVTCGQQLHTAMANQEYFPLMAMQMIKVGEESGTLEKMLEKIAEIYEADIDHFIGNLSQLLEPLIMVILGVLIGGLVIAMYLPIFKLGTVF